jgi:hypothetical protein
MNIRRESTEKIRKRKMRKNKRNKRNIKRKESQAHLKVRLF